MRLHDYDASGNCLKVRILLALLGQPYERVSVDLFGGDTLTDASRELLEVVDWDITQPAGGNASRRLPARLTPLR
jgi:hypothetical protein